MEVKAQMKPMAFVFAAILLVAVLINGGGFYGGMVSDYESLGAVEKIDTQSISLQGEALLNDTSAVAEDMESGVKSGIEDIPFIGGTLVQVFSVYQIVKSYMINLWTAFTIGTDLLDQLLDLIPYALPPLNVTLIQTTLIILFIGSIIYLILGRKTT